MNKLFNNLKKKSIDATDTLLATNYITELGIQETEYAEYADSFVNDCYTYNEETGEHEPKTIEPCKYCKKHAFHPVTVTIWEDHSPVKRTFCCDACATRYQMSCE